MAQRGWQKQCREKRRFWYAHVQAWAKSGLMQVEYCRQHDLDVHRFGYWKKKTAGKSVVSSGPAKPQFVEVPAVMSSPAPKHDSRNDSGVEIHLGDLTIALAEEFSPAVLLRALDALGGIS